MKQKWQDVYSKHKEKLFIPLFIAVLFFASYFLLIQVTKPESYQAKLFSVSEKTIRSPQTVVDTKKTEEEKRKASDEVEDVYVYNRETAANQVAFTESIFDYINEVRTETADAEKEAKAEAESNNKPVPKPVTDANKLKSFKEKLVGDHAENITENVSDATFINLLNATQADLKATEDQVISEVKRAMDDRIRESNLNTKKIQARDAIELSAMPSNYKTSAKSLVSNAIIPNETVDKEQTKARKKEAADNVVPEKILQGQVIVQEGQIIDRETYRQLELLNLIDQKMPIKQYTGYAFLVLALFLLLYFYTKKRKYPPKKRRQTILIFTSVYVTTLVFLLVIRWLEGANIMNIAFVFPAAFMPMVLKILLNERFAFFGVIVVAITSLFVFESDTTSIMNVLMVAFILLSGLTSVVALKDYSRRIAIFQTGMIVGALNVVYALLLLGINNSTLLSLNAVQVIFYAFLGGIGSFMLGLALIPLFETLFGILTTSRLIELANPNHPLLKKILMKAPGTYHHSMMVANLAETCADEIGANSLLVRVGCFYHDIGKTLRPPYFVENQLQGINPHDRLTPKQSRDIILAHTTDGAEILKENHMPQPIIDIALMHHGTTILKYFYVKEKENHPDVSESEFRYSGPKPQTKEIAIINIADSVEAAVRSCDVPTKEKISTIIDGIIRERILDGQFTECDITLHEIETIRDTLKRTLNGIYHQRIQYPDDSKGEKE
ncbi:MULTISPECIES: HD family phosphohydrolase [unclassified Listeria]|uniref:HD family phosphohydrolase n=1 Tax=unclassified Listeria TaxID=2642072 RepID=UPI000B58DA7B|nr:MULTISPECIES: HD family phosphohydrolase [unclassified Listeria]